MLDTFESLGLSTLMVIVGAVILALGIAFGILSYRQRSRSLKEYTDAATRRLYREEAQSETSGKPWNDPPPSAPNGRPPSN